MVGFSMRTYGVGSTNLGSVPPTYSRHSSRPSRVRYLRISSMISVRGSYELDETDSRITPCTITYLYIRNSPDGANLINSGHTTISSTYFSRPNIAGAMERYANADPITAVDGSDLIGGLSHDYAITIDLGSLEYIYDVVICTATQVAGLRIEGSLNGSTWSIMNDVSGRDMPKRYTTNMRERWYTFTPYSTDRHEHTGLSANRWGILFGDANRSPYFIRIASLEFLDSPGGTNLAVGGTPNKYVVPDNKDLSPAFNGSLADRVSISSSMGIGYTFTSEVQIGAVVLALGDNQDLCPTEFSVVYSNTDVDWTVVKHFATPVNTWPDGSYTPVEFTL